MEKKFTYVFDEGDVICNYMYNWVAVKVAGFAGWKHSNQDDFDIGAYWTDEAVERMLNNGTWFYMGNRQERENIDKGYANAEI